MSSWTGGAVFHIRPKEILKNPMLCSLVCSSGLVVSSPLSGCPNPCGYPTTHPWSLRWRVSEKVLLNSRPTPPRLAQLVKPLQMTAELEVEALRDILRDLVQLCHHLTHDVTTRTHDQKLMVFAFLVPT